MAKKMEMGCADGMGCAVSKGMVDGLGCAVSLIRRHCPNMGYPEHMVDVIRSAHGGWMRSVPYQETLLECGSGMPGCAREGTAVSPEGDTAVPGK